MKKIVFVLSVIVGGCGGISKQDLDSLEKRIDTKLAQENAELSKKINDTDSKYANMLAIEQKVTNGVAKIDANAKLLESANTTMIQILTAQKNALKEQLNSVENQLEALQKPK